MKTEKHFGVRSAVADELSESKTLHASKGPNKKMWSKIITNNFLVSVRVCVVTVLADMLLRETNPEAQKSIAFDLREIKDPYVEGKFRYCLMNSFTTAVVAALEEFLKRNDLAYRPRAFALEALGACRWLAQ